MKPPSAQILYSGRAVKTKLVLFSKYKLRKINVHESSGAASKKSNYMKGSVDHVKTSRKYNMKFTY
jgi:hypothetical protein